MEYKLVLFSHSEKGLNKQLESTIRKKLEILSSTDNPITLFFLEKLLNDQWLRTAILDETTLLKTIEYNGTKLTIDVISAYVPVSIPIVSDLISLLNADTSSRLEKEIEFGTKICDIIDSL